MPAAVRRYPLQEGEAEDRSMQTWWRDLRMLAATALLVPVIAAADGADELALTIEQNLAGIGFRIDVRPSQAAQDLEAQGRQLELLATEAPDHPALPKLEKTYQTLQTDLANALAGAASSAARGQGAGQVPAAPEGFDAGMDQVQTLQDRAEAELFSGHPEQASGWLKQAEAQIAALESRYGSEIPPGHVPLLVAKEKLAALKDQLADSQ
jgi:hypothetical protein